MSSTKILWRVQVRKSRAHKWVNKGLFETRSVARNAAFVMRDPHYPIYPKYGDLQSGYGFGNTRVLRFVRGGK